MFALYITQLHLSPSVSNTTVSNTHQQEKIAEKIVLLVQNQAALACAVLTVIAGYH